MRGEGRSMACLRKILRKRRAGQDDEGVGRRGGMNVGRRQARLFTPGQGCALAEHAASGLPYCTSGWDTASIGGYCGQGREGGRGAGMLRDGGANCLMRRRSAWDGRCASTLRWQGRTAPDVCHAYAIYCVLCETAGVLLMRLVDACRDVRWLHKRRAVGPIAHRDGTHHQ